MSRGIITGYCWHLKKQSCVHDFASKWKGTKIEAQAASEQGRIWSRLQRGASKHHSADDFRCVPTLRVSPTAYTTAPKQMENVPAWTMLLTISAGRALREQGQFGSYGHCLHVFPPWYSTLPYSSQLGGLTYKGAVLAPWVFDTMPNGWSHQGCGDVVPFTWGRCCKAQVLPSVQPSSATEDAMKKQEPTIKKSQARGL